MVRELVQWFGELEELGVNVVGSTMPIDQCDQLRSEILATEEEIHDLQAELRYATGQQKTFIVSQIRKKQGELAKLHNEATTQGCSNIP